MNTQTLLNLLLCSVVAYCVIVRLNLLHGNRNTLQRVSMILILVGACFAGIAPIVEGYSVTWADLFLPAGLAMFFVRYVYKVEKFFAQGND